LGRAQDQWTLERRDLERKNASLQSEKDNLEGKINLLTEEIDRLNELLARVREEANNWMRRSQELDFELQKTKIQLEADFKKTLVSILVHFVIPIGKRT